MRQCNLRSLCLCAVSVLSRDTVITFDICTKGHLRAWAKRSQTGRLGDQDDEGLKVISQDDGRLYQVVLPNSETRIVIGDLLTYVKIFTKEGSGKSGLCGKENHTKDDFNGAKNNTRKGPLTDCAESQPEGCEELLKIWR